MFYLIQCNYAYPWSIGQINQENNEFVDMLLVYVECHQNAAAADVYAIQQSNFQQRFSLKISG